MKKFLVTLFTIALFGGSNAMAQVPTLPDPDLVIAPGETIATQHDDFYAYSALLNNLIFPEDGWDFSTGTGGLDILIYTGAAGAENNINTIPGNPPEYNFEDPLDAPGGAVDSMGANDANTWGLNDQDQNGIDDGAGIEGPVTVDQMYDWLQTAFDEPTSIPVFYFDMNQTGDEPDLYVAGKVSIWDAVNDTEIAFWAFDEIENNQFDEPNEEDLSDPAWVFADGTLTIDGVGTVNHNLGSGKADYIAFAPTMDLSLYTGQGYLFRADFYIAGLSNGFEELFITGAIAPPGNVVPEPTSMLLLGSGLVGMIGLRKKKKS